jgi:hypothetical protein
VIRTSFVLALALACACGQRHPRQNSDGNLGAGDGAAGDGAIDAPVDTGVGSDGGTLTTCPGVSYPGPALCGDGHWRWERPTPIGYTLASIVAFSPSDVWAVGDAGTVVHFDGASWRVDPTPICDGLASLWGTSATNLWAVGTNGRIVHRDAIGWHVVDSGTCAALFAVWGSPTGTIWIAGDKGTVLRGDTHGFAPVAFPTSDFLTGMFGFSDSDVWVIASRTALYHWNGTTWANVVSSNTWSWDTIWGADPDHLFIGGFLWSADAETVWTFSEATAAMPTPTILGGSQSGGLGGTSATDVWFVAGNSASHFDGAKWTATSGIGIASTLLAVAPTGASDAWAVGWDGERLHWNGSAWTDVTPAHDAISVWAESPSDAWLATTSGLAHWNGSAWSAPVETGLFDVVWGTASADVYAVGYLAAKHWDGSAWTTLALPPASQHWYAVGGSSANDIWIGGYGGGLVHWNGSAWSTVSATTADIYGLWSFAPNDAWAATAKGILHWDGATWSPTGPLTSAAVLGVWGSSPHDVYVGGYGALYHFDGATWTMPIARANAAFRKVWGQSASDVWVLENGTFSDPHDVAHWNGSTWTTHVSVSSMELLGLGGAGELVWAADIQGGLVRFVP